MNAYSYININNPCVRSYYIYSTGPLHPPKLLLDTSHWSCFLTWGNSVCVVAERFSYYCLSSQWTIVKKNPHCHFYCGLMNHFGMPLSREAVGQEDLPGRIMTGSLGMSPALPFLWHPQMFSQAVSVFTCVLFITEFLTRSVF